MGIISEAKAKLAEKNITWREAYTEKNREMKDQYEAVIGPGCYFRFEGADQDSGDEYVAVIGPGRVRRPRPMWYAGVRKQPSDYPTGGQYFPSLRKAAEYAQKTWGILVPASLKHYDVGVLKGIKSKIEDWKDSTEDSESKEASSFNIIVVEAAERLIKRHGYSWFDVDDAITGSSPGFEEAAASEPHLRRALNAAVGERTKRRIHIANAYGAEHVDDDFYKIWIVHKADEGTYLVSVGPYCGEKFDQDERARDKFGVFVWKLNEATQQDIDSKVESLIKEYADKYGVALERSDINVPSLEDKPFAGEITVGKSGRQKIFGSPEWKRQVADYYGVPEGRGMHKKLRDEWKARKTEWKARLDEAYRISKESGDAFIRQQPPPPRIDLVKRPYGQQIPTAIYREAVNPDDEGGMSPAQIVEKYGFDSIAEAVGRLTTTVMPGAPIGDVPSTTSDDLKAARQERDQDSRQGRGIGIPQHKKVMKKEPQAVPAAPTAPAKGKPEKAKQEPEIQDLPDVELEESDVFASTRAALSELVKLAESMDDAGRHAEAEEIHGILRRHIRS